MLARIPRILPPFALRPALAVVLLGLAGFLVDLFVKPVSSEGFLLILLAASPFLLSLLRPERPTAVADPVEPEAPARPASQPLRTAPTPAPRAVPERPLNPAPRPAAARPPAERQPAQTVRSAPRSPQQSNPSGATVQRPAPRREEAQRANPRDPAKLL